MMIGRPRLPAGKSNMTLAARWPGYRRKASRRPGFATQRWVIISLALHLLLAAGLWRHGANRQAVEDKPPIYADIVMMQKHAGAVAPEAKFTSGTGEDTGPRGAAQPAGQGEPQHAAPAPSPPPSPPQAAREAVVREAGAPKSADADALPLPAATPASPPAPASEPQPASVAAAAPSPSAISPSGNPPQTNLGDAVDIGNWQVTGRHVTPPGMDSTVHNVPPVYPAEAVRAAEEGTVVLLVTVSPDGSAEKIEVSSSSGYERLDRAARAAVSRWHFTPGQQDGIAVESVYPVKIHFALKN